LTSSELPAEVANGLTQLWQSQNVTGATSDMVYSVLHEAIVSWILPPGQRLGEEQLARLFDVSRTPIREAIFRLETEQFAERIPRRGLVVSHVTPQQIIDVYVVRGALDGLCAALAAEHATPADVSTLNWINASFARAAEAGDLAQLAEINLQFHEAIAQVTRNALLQNLVKQVHYLVRRFHSTTFSQPGRAHASVAEHQRLIDAIAAGDARHARQMAEEHMVTARGIRVAMLEHELQPVERASS
jgi:DNA-binding GntR family transcriptional regulator